MNGPVVVDLAGPRLSAAERDRLRQPLVGMVILFSRNYESLGQLRELCDQIHALRDPPLLIAVDHEGGRVQRFRHGFTRLPAMAELGRCWERDVLEACRAACAAGFVLGAELRAVGVDLSFTPVLDLDWGRSAVIGDRALHADPRVVTLLAAGLAHGLAVSGMSNCGKHFPGHGWAGADSHLELPLDERPLERILDADAMPYGSLALVLDGVMPAHVVYPAVDAQPAGFSRRWIEDILRGRLGFSGAVFSDDLSMAGARAAGDVLQAAQAALAAGCDLVLVCNDPAAADQVLESLEWRPGAAHAGRMARLVPRGPAPGPQALHAEPRYRAALQALRALLPGPVAGAMVPD